MKKLEKIAMTLIIICVGWMIISTIYGVGRAKGIVQAREELMMQCEDRIEWAIQETSDELLIACETKITEFENQCDKLIEEAKEEVLAQF